MARKMFSIALTSMLVVALVAVGGCAGGDGGGGGEEPPADQPVAGGTMSFFIVEPDVIDPYNLNESEGTQVGQAIGDGLVVLDYVTQEVKPAAAVSWEPNADATVFTFKLREGAKFHDGTSVTAKDFIYSWNRIVNPKSNVKDPSEIAYHLEPIKGYDEVRDGKATEMTGLKAIDDLTLEITLKYAWADFPAVLAHPAFAPVPQAAVEKDPAAFAEMPISNGPFKMAEPWKHDQYIKLVRFEDYNGSQKPYLDGVEFKIFKDENVAYREFEAGTLDFSENIPTGRIEEAKTKYGASDDGLTVQPGKGVLTGTELATYYLVCNLKDPVLGKLEIRKALSYAINRPAITDTIYEGTRQPATGIVPPAVPGFQEDAWPDSVYDEAKAIEELKKAGYDTTNRLKIKLAFNSGGGHEKLMEVIQADWKKIGVDATFEVREFPQHLDILDKGQFQIARLGWIADYPLMDNFLYPLFETKADNNYSEYSNPTVDADLLAARATTDEAARLAKYGEIEKMVGTSLPVVPIVFYAHHAIGSNRLHDFTYSPNGLGSFEYAWLTDGGQ